MGTGPFPLKLSPLHFNPLLSFHEDPNISIRVVGSFFVCIKDGIVFLVSSKNGVYKRVYEAQGRSFPLQVLAFLRGGRRASSCLRGLATPPFPLESSTFRYNPLCSFKQSEIPFDYYDYKDDEYQFPYVIM
ncbi:hypothetical protein ASG66_16045 [Bacillus sp. Leaf406]|nr:hypothetical protein ASG66_16045 [Bacillus sp. Leaf406]